MLPVRKDSLWLTETSGEVLYVWCKIPVCMKLICKDLTKWTASTIPAHNKLLSHHRDLDDVFFGTGHQLSSGLLLVSNSGVGSRLGHSKRINTVQKNFS